MAIYWFIRSVNTQRASRDAGRLKRGIRKSPGGFRGIAIRINTDDIPATMNIVLLFGDQMQITAGIRYRILIAKPIFTEMSKRKIKMQSIPHIRRMLPSLSSNGILIGWVAFA
jgi:hypothetical protein